MKKGYLVTAIIAAVLVLASSIPLMSSTVASDEYQPVYPEESGKNVTAEKSIEQWQKEHTIKVKVTRTLKYEQGYLETKEIYTGTEFKNRFGRDNFTKERRIPLSAEHAEALGIREGEEIISVTEEERVFTTEGDPDPWWEDYHYPPWMYYEDDGLYVQESPINMAWENTDMDAVKDEMEEEGWEDIPDECGIPPIPCQVDHYVYDPEYGWIVGDGVACAFPPSTPCFHCHRVWGGYHIRLWSLSSGAVVGQAHEDSVWDPIHGHQAVAYESVEELVADFYDEAEWTVYDDNYPLDNPTEDPYSNEWCTQIVYSTISLGAAVDNDDLPWNNWGQMRWFGQDSVYYYGGDAAQSGVISHNQKSCISAPVEGPGTLKFRWKVSSEASYDYLNFYIDGNRKTRISGEVSWQQKSYSISSGWHTVKWEYKKDGSVNSGLDCGWLDTVSISMETEIPLSPGWNLVSLPLIPEDSDITVVISADTLASGNVGNVGLVYWYDPAIEGYRVYKPGVGGSLTTMEDGKGYWIFMVSPDTLTVRGLEVPLPGQPWPAYDVFEGWNMIGFKSTSSMHHTSYLYNIAGDYSVLWGWDAGAQEYFSVYPLGEHDGNMEPGHGYWLWATADGTIVPPEGDGGSKSASDGDGAILPDKAHLPPYPPYPPLPPSSYTSEAE